ncbi:DUF3991 and TOPRIM domain-containing protein [Mesorhizobium sp. WSM3626]|uniref:DUF3991 and TOPRIM domain-containing protein n=1 Tax=Mesorhizobium sp. WSM3626 TaxID=1040987 RepID=UPI0032AF4B88
MRDGRHLPAILRAATAAGLLRERPHGSIWAAHRDVDGTVTGWEERGPHWRGVATAGAKVLFRFGRPEAFRLCVTEAAIDAMSLAALADLRPDTVYLSTAGGWSPATAAAIHALAAKPGVQLVANHRQQCPRRHLCRQGSGACRSGRMQRRERLRQMH